MERAELVFVPSPGVGHLVSTIEIAKLLVQRDSRISITIFIINLPTHPSSSLIPTTSDDRIRYVDLPPVSADPTPTTASHPLAFLNTLVEMQKPNVKQALSQRSEPTKLAGFVIDMFCTPMMDVANEFGVPTYIYYTSSAGCLNLSFSFTSRQDRGDAIDEDLVVPGFRNPVPAKVLPSSLMEIKENSPVAQMFLNHRRRYAEAKGIMINTFLELESSILHSLPDNSPPVYPVGPILNINGGPESEKREKYIEIMKWLDDQPRSSVLFLCFGSMGTFSQEQVKEIATALENSGYRFLWSLRRAPPKGKIAMPSDYDDFTDVLPEGFLDRTAKIGQVIGWAPQVAVLAHPAIRGFVSHCGWNSTLESIWFGVPVVTWPLYEEQQFNAFCLLKEFELAEEIKMDYRKKLFIDDQEIVGAEVIERGIRRVMELDEEKRRRVKGMSVESRKTLEEGGSSFQYLAHFIEDVFKNMA